VFDGFVCGALVQYRFGCIVWGLCQVNKEGCFSTGLLSSCLDRDHKTRYHSDLEI
jgi:hypothetical protein